MRLRLLLLLALLASLSLHAQQTSEYIFGAPEWETLQKVFEAPDGRLNVIGTRTVNNLPQIQFFQLDTDGHILQEKDLGTMAASLFVDPNPDGSFWLARFGTAGYLFTRFDASGTAQDSFVYAHADLVDDYFFALRRTPDGGFVLAFKNYDSPTPGVRLVRLSAAGAVVYNKFVQSGDAELNNNCLAVLPNGRVVLAVIDFTQGYRVLCYNPTGLLLWTKSVPAIPTFGEFGLLPMDNGRVVFYGPHGSNGNDYFRGYAAAYDGAGQFVWNIRFDSIVTGLSIYKAVQDGDDVVLAGDYLNQEGIGVAVVKVAPDGHLKFVRKFPLLDSESGQLVLSNNGDYLMTGYLWHDTGQGYVAGEAYGLNLQSDGTLNWLVKGQFNWVNAVRSVAQTATGDIWLGGNYRPSGSAGPFDHYLLKISGLEPPLLRQIHGRVALDLLENCTPDSGEPPLPNWTLRAQNAQMTRYATTGPDGQYALRLNGGNAELTVLMPNTLWEACSPAYTADFSNFDSVEINPLTRQTAQCPLLGLDATTPFLRRCFNNDYYFSWQNEGTATAQHLQLTIELDPFFNFVSASLPLAGQSGQTLHFDLPDLPPGAWGEMSLTFELSCQADFGQTHCLTANLQSDALCPDSEGHTASARDCQPNVGSFDPNDMRAFVNDRPREGDIRRNEDFKYQIRFQNTGTDTAFTVVIVDTLPVQLDLDRIKPGAASHPYTWSRLGENLLKFVFEDIRLPDSLVNEPASHGFVDFYVHQLPDLPIGTRIENKADIFFDLNAPVETNTHRLVVKRTVSTQQPADAQTGLSLEPNPSTDGRIRIRSAGPAIERLEIFDTKGRLLQQEKVESNDYATVLPAVPGVYWLRVYRAGRPVGQLRAVRGR